MKGGYHKCSLEHILTWEALYESKLEHIKYDRDEWKNGYRRMENIALDLKRRCNHYKWLSICDFVVIIILAAIIIF